MKSLAVALLLAGVALESLAEGRVSVPMNLVNETGTSTSVGPIVVTEPKYGLVFTPALAGLPAGLHGFHVHEYPSCLPAEKDGKPVPGLAAGGHYDPHKTGQHGFPWGEGHLGDLPALYVDTEGNAVQPVLAPRLKLIDLVGRSLMIHVGGDNHADHPAALGGGGDRLVCGIIP